MSIWTMEISDFEGVVQAGVTVPEGSSGTNFLLWTRAYGALRVRVLGLFYKISTLCGWSAPKHIGSGSKIMLK